MNTARPSVAGPDPRPTLPKLRPPSGTAYLFHFDPIGGWASSTALNPDDSVADQRTDESRKSVVEGVYRHFRGSLLPLLYAARLCGIDADRIAVRLGPAGRKFNRDAFAKRLLEAVERAIRPNAWLTLAADDTHLPRWIVGSEEASEAVGIDRTQADRGRWLIDGELEGLHLSSPQPNDEPDELYASLLAHAVALKWDMVGPSRLPATSPKDFFTLVRIIRTGEPAGRLEAAEALAALTPPCDEVPVLLASIDVQTGAVQVYVIEAIRNSLREAGQVGVEAARETAIVGLFQRLLQYEGLAATAAGKLIGELVCHVPRHKNNCYGMVEGLAQSGLATYAIPTGNDIDSLVLAAPRSREAKEKLRTRKGLGSELSQHTLLTRLRLLAGPDTHAAVDEVKDVFRLLEGCGFGTLEANREVALLVRQVLEKTGRKLECTSCRRGATLAILSHKDTPAGVFNFYHGGRKTRTYHAGTGSLPRLQLAD